MAYDKFNYKDEYRVFEKFNMNAVSTDVTMFNSENELTNLVGTYLEDVNSFSIYINGRYVKEFYTLEFIFDELRKLGFGKNYDVTWSMFTTKDNNGNEKGLFSINIPDDE